MDKDRTSKPQAPVKPEGEKNKQQSKNEQKQHGFPLHDEPIGGG